MIPVDAVVARLLPKADPTSIRACRVPQRHRSWSVSLGSGVCCWVKAGRHDSPVAGVRREAIVLERLDGAWSTPRLLASDPSIPAMATAHLDGRSLADCADGEVIERLASLADWVRAFSTDAPLQAYPCSVVAPWDLFGAAPDVGRLLGPGARLWEATAKRAGLRPLAPVPPGPIAGPRGAVHGSFDEDNVLFDAAGTVSGVLDLEGARVGPVALDVAGMAVDLLLGRGPQTARAWLDLWPDERIAVQACMQLRLWNRHQHEALSDGLLDDALVLMAGA